MNFVPLSMEREGMGLVHHEAAEAAAEKLIQDDGNECMSDSSR
jgi:hypothetical protein